MIKLEENKLFLQEQRKKGRPGCIAGIDMKMKVKENRKCTRLESEKNRMLAEKTRKLQSSVAQLVSSSSSSTNSKNDAGESQPGPSNVIGQCKKEANNKKVVITPELVTS